MELSEEAKKSIAQSEKDFKEGRFYTHEQMKQRHGLK